MQPRSAALLWDLVTAAKRIQSFIAGKTWEDYGSDLLLRSGVERQFEIAGEAMRVLRNLDPETAKRVPNIHKIVGMRNILIHGYALDVSSEERWSEPEDGGKWSRAPRFRLGTKRNRKLTTRWKPAQRHTAMGYSVCGCDPKRRTSWGQPHASAILPAHIFAASSSGTSTTANPPRNSLVST